MLMRGKIRIKKIKQQNWFALKGDQNLLSINFLIYSLNVIKFLNK